MHQATREKLPMNENSDHSRIHQLLEAWTRAVREKDMAGVLAQHTDDIVMFDVPLPMQARGLDEYRKTWELFFNYNRGGPGAFDLTELHIVAGDTVAYCHGLVKICDAKVRLTVGLRKQHGDWLIAHEHHSYPISLDE
jgi:ketosteroid isomerase-like protein